MFRMFATSAGFTASVVKSSVRTSFELVFFLGGNKAKTGLLAPPYRARRTVRRLIIAISALAASVNTGSQAHATPSICDAVTGNLVVNCGFETGDFTGWTLSGNFAGFGAFVTTQPVNSGNDAAAFGAFGTDAILSQTFSDVPNATLTFSFFLRSSEFGANSNDFSVLFDSTTLMSVTNLAAQDSSGSRGYA